GRRHGLRWQHGRGRLQPLAAALRRLCRIPAFQGPARPGRDSRSLDPAVARSLFSAPQHEPGRRGMARRPPAVANRLEDLIFRLQSYWAEQGCVILQPYDVEVGAGTLHPATTLRALGPETWNCAYVQPSRRPKDGRYGENPNRLQHYYQFQVILKPS